MAIRTYEIGSVNPADLIATFDTDTSIMTISGTGPCITFRRGGSTLSGTNMYSPLYTERENITSLVIEDGITSIGAYFFDNVTLPIVRLPDTVTYALPEYAFYYANITDVYLPDTITTMTSSSIFFRVTMSNLYLPNNITSLPLWRIFHFSTVTNTYLPKKLSTLTSVPTSSTNGTSVYGANVYIDSSNTAYTTIDGVLYNKSCERLIYAPVNNPIAAVPEGVTHIEEGAMAHRTPGSTIILPSTLEVIHEEAFFNTTFESIVIPKSVYAIYDNSFDRDNQYGAQAYTLTFLSDYIEVRTTSYSTKNTNIIVRGYPATWIYRWAVDRGAQFEAIRFNVLDKISYARRSFEKLRLALCDAGITIDETDSLYYFTTAIKEYRDAVKAGTVITQNGYFPGVFNGLTINIKTDDLITDEYADVTDDGTYVYTKSLAFPYNMVMRIQGGVRSYNIIWESNTIGEMKDDSKQYNPLNTYDTRNLCDYVNNLVGYKIDCTTNRINTESIDNNNGFRLRAFFGGEKTIGWSYDKYDASAEPPEIPMTDPDNILAGYGKSELDIIRVSGAEYTSDYQYHAKQCKPRSVYVIYDLSTNSDGFTLTEDTQNRSELLSKYQTKPTDFIPLAYEFYIDEPVQNMGLIHGATTDTFIGAINSCLEDNYNYACNDYRGIIKNFKPTDNGVEISVDSYVTKYDDRAQMGDICPYTVRYELGEMSYLLDDYLYIGSYTSDRPYVKNHSYDLGFNLGFITEAFTGSKDRILADGDTGSIDPLEYFISEFQTYTETPFTIGYIFDKKEVKNYPYSIPPAFYTAVPQSVTFDLFTDTYFTDYEFGPSNNEYTPNGDGSSGYIEPPAGSSGNWSGA